MDKGNLFFIGFCGLFLVGGLAAARPVWENIRKGMESTEWPTVEGEITRSRDVRSTMRLAEVMYEYSVDGRTYEQARIAYVPPMFDSFRPAPHERYDLGDTVAVYYRPGDPADALLEPGAPLGGIINKLLVMLLLTGIGAAGVVWGIKREWG